MGVMTDFPSTLRYYGPNVTAWNQMLQGMVYETLLGLHPTTLDWMPALATHWQISDDKRTFRFRLDPNARFSDGTPVTSEDVIASWALMVDTGLQDPARTLVYSNFEEPVAESKYLVSVRAKTVNWQNFLYFSGLYIFPAHVLTTIAGEEYVREYNYKMLPGTGPYIVSEEDVDKGTMVTIRRRPDYWAETHRRNIGTSNFDEIQQLVVRDRNLEFEMFKKGDVDYYFVNRAQMWVEDLDYDNIARGLNQKRKIFNHNPQGVQGVAINTRREPLDDVRVRKALRHLFNRESMVEKLMYNEYAMADSIFPNSVYESSGNENITYDPQKAMELLAEAGWKERDPQGRLTRNGQPLSIEIVHGDQASERFFTVYQEDLRRVGITLNLRLTTFETLVKLLDERTFGMASHRLHRQHLSEPGAELARPPGRRKQHQQHHRLQERARRSDHRSVRKGVRLRHTRHAAAGTRRPHHQRPSLDSRVDRAVRTRGLLEQVRPAAWLHHAHRRLPRYRIPLVVRRREVASARGGDPRFLDRPWRGVERRQVLAGLRAARGAAGQSCHAMTGYFIRRLLLVVPTFIGITLAVFVVMHFVPGGPIERQLLAYKMAVATEGGAGGGLVGFGAELPPDALEELRRFYGFDKPLHIRYLSWLWNVVRLDLGTSYVYQESGLGGDPHALSRVDLPRPHGFPP